MTIVFKYSRLPKKKNDFKSPTIKVTLRGRAKRPLNVIALLDSGADLSVIPLSIAKILDLDLPEETSQSHGIGGSITTKRSKMIIILKKGHEDYQFAIPVEVSYDEDVPIILGRANFFDKFIISIDEKNEKIKLKRNSKFF